MTTRKHPHYYKNVAHLTEIDVYRTLDLFGVTDPCIQHAVKKLLVTGARGAKDFRKDLEEAIVTLQRKLEMMDEDASVQKSHTYVGTGPAPESLTAAGP